MPRLLLILLLGLFTIHGQAQTKVTAMSFNIRLDVDSDGENKWSLRKGKVAGLMNYYAPDFIGAQEVQHHQLEYLLSQLKQYRFIGVGRDDGKTGGEYSCIFYNADKYTVVKQSTFWLSATPDVVSRGWDAACNRVCTYGLFRSNTTRKLFWVFNTHLDHMGVTARRESVKLIAERIHQLNKGLNYPVILMGDFNSGPEDEPVRIVKSFLVNTREESKTPPYGPFDTWNAFKFHEKPDGCIDYIFVSKGTGIIVQKFATITDSYDLKYPSDHFPILSQLLLK